MMRHTDRRIMRTCAKILTVIALIFMTASVCLTYLNGIPVNADSEVIISAITSKTDIGPGDLLSVDVVANRFPGITEFGSIEFNYDNDNAEYVSFEQGKELSNYVFTETQTDGVITVSGKDQMMTVNSEGDEDEVAAASFESDNQVVLFTILIRIRPEGSGDINCWISDAGTFTSPTESVTSKIGSGITLPIRREGLSSDATISVLRIRGTSITPDFLPNITDYSCSVERSVTEVQVSVTTTNLWAAVVIDGTQNLSFGENVVTIDVTAQDGVSHMRYTIHVTEGRVTFLIMLRSLIRTELHIHSLMHLMRLLFRTDST